MRPPDFLEELPRVARRARRHFRVKRAAGESQSSSRYRNWKDVQVLLQRGEDRAASQAMLAPRDAGSSGYRALVFCIPVLHDLLHLLRHVYDVLVFAAKRSGLHRSAADAELAIKVLFALQYFLTSLIFFRTHPHRQSSSPPRHGADQTAVAGVVQSGKQTSLRACADKCQISAWHLRSWPPC